MSRHYSAAESVTLCEEDLHRLHLKLVRVQENLKRFADELAIVLREQCSGQEAAEWEDRIFHELWHVLDCLAAIDASLAVHGERVPEQGVEDDASRSTWTPGQLEGAGEVMGTPAT